MTLTLYDVPADATTALTAGGGSTAVSMTTPGQNALLPFVGANGQRVSLRVTANAIAQSYISIRKPDGTNLVSPTWVTTTTAFIDTQVLPSPERTRLLLIPIWRLPGT